MPIDSSNSARSAILNRIRTANPSSGRQSSDYAQLPRDYVREGKLPPAEILALFEHRLVEYDAHVYHAEESGIAAMVNRLLSERSKTRLLIPTSLEKQWLPAGFEFQPDEALPFEALDRYDGVITAATVAVAATGSIALQHGPGQGRRALSLIPDYHLCIVRADQIVETVPQSFARLDPLKPTTFVSGPSATADIEMTRIKGVHGPRFLDVIIVGS
jgi:L-lactate dehydrogenase complex protein LldG